MKTETVLTKKKIFFFQVQGIKLAVLVPIIYSYWFSVVVIYFFIYALDKIEFCSYFLTVTQMIKSS